jgi:hypothetical protein
LIARLEDHPAEQKRGRVLNDQIDAVRKSEPVGEHRPEDDAGRVTGEAVR